MPGFTHSPYSSSSSTSASTLLAELSASSSGVFTSKILSRLHTQRNPRLTNSERQIKPAILKQKYFNDLFSDFLSKKVLTNDSQKGYHLYLVSEPESYLGDMKHKTISNQSSELLSRMSMANKPCFTIEEAYQIMNESNNDAIRKLLSDLVKRGLLMRLKKGLYYTIPYEREPDTFMPNWHITAGYLSKEVNYYIGYFSALEIHSLITQPSLQEQIVVDKQVKPSIIKIKDIQFRFIFHNKKHFFGAKNVWIDDFNRIKCSDFEKTVIDCLYKPHYAGGIVEISKAIFKLKDRLDYKKLFEYIKIFDSQAVVKRVGFLLELLGINPPMLKQLYKLKTKSFTQLDPSLPKEGRMISKWSLRVNVDEETIRSSIRT
jgi:predicted transcriptional regulator of viral defense system